MITEGSFWSRRNDHESTQPQHYYDPDRINVLVLGIRGETDPHGGLLSDTIMLVSIHKPTNRVAIFSIPRDLYISIPGHEKKEKINFAYALGFERGGWREGLSLTEQTVEEVFDTEIDYGAVVDFEAFRSIITTLGGIDVYVPRDFKETQQFTNFPLELKKGWHHMDATTALYYARSRYSTSDFDRARRQQEILLAVKKKALQLGVIANPVKALSIARSIERHVRTNADYALLSDFLGIARGVRDEEVIKRVFDTSPEGLLHSTTENGTYVLLPREGSFEPLQSAVQGVFNPPSPSPSPHATSSLTQ